MTTKAGVTDNGSEPLEILPMKNEIMIIKRERSDKDEALRINQCCLDAVNYAKKKKKDQKKL